MNNPERDPDKYDREYFKSVADSYKSSSSEDGLADMYTFCFKQPSFWLFVIVMSVLYALSQL